MSRAIDGLQVISQNPHPLTIAEVGKIFGIPKSSASEILYTVLDKNILELGNEDVKAFKLGLKLYEITLLALATTDHHRDFSRNRGRYPWGFPPCAPI